MKRYAVATMRPLYRSPRILTPLLAILCLAPGLRAEMSLGERAENVLFQQYDTVATMPSKLVPADPEADPGDEFHNSVRLSALELYVAFAKTSPNTLADLERSYPKLLLGAKDPNLFDPPPGDAFGPILPHEAFIAVAESSAQPNLEPDFTGTPSETIEGRKVWTLALLDDRHPEWGRFYAAQIDTRYFVVALGREDFLKAVRALTAPAEPARPNTIRAWETFHTHDYWIYRTVRGHIDQGLEQLKLFSAFVFYADLAAPAGSLRIWTADQNAPSAPELSSNHKFFDFKPISNGVWQAEIPFKVEDSNRDVFFALFGMFGFTVVV